MTETSTEEIASLEERIASLEQELMAGQEKLAELRKQMPREHVPDTTFATVDGGVKLSELFGGKRDLILVHNMGARCSYCTLWADGFNGLVHHLSDRAAFVVVSPDTPEQQLAFAASRGWRFRMVSDSDKSFTRTMGYITEHEGRDYFLPGYSTFRLNDDGTIERVAHAAFGPGDVYNPVWHLFDLLADGPDGWQPQFEYRQPAAGGQ